MDARGLPADEQTSAERSARPVKRTRARPVVKKNDARVEEPLPDSGEPSVVVDESLYELDPTNASPLADDVDEGAKTAVHKISEP